MRRERGRIAKRVAKNHSAHVRVSAPHEKAGGKCLKRSAKAGPEGMNTHLKTLAESPGM